MTKGFCGELAKHTALSAFLTTSSLPGHQQVSTEVVDCLGPDGSTTFIHRKDWV